MKRVATAVATIAALCATGAVAKDSERTETRLVGQRFAQCVVKQRLALAREFVRTVAPGDDLPRRMGALMSGNCLVRAMNGDSGQMTFPASTFHNTIAEELVRMDHPIFTPMNVQARAPLRHAELRPVGSFSTTTRGKRAERERAAFDNDRFDAVLARVGECVVRAHQGRSHALLKTEIVSPDEKAKMTDLAPVIGGCLKKGTIIKLDIGYLRGVIARSYWRLADEGVSTSPAGAF